MSTRRLELFLVVQMKLRNLHNNRLMEFEVGKAIEEESSGCACSHTDTIERWCTAYLNEVAA